MSKIQDGISYKDGSLDIDFNKDWHDDILLIANNNFNYKTFSRKNITVFYGHTLIKPESFSKEDMQKRNFIRTLIKNYNKLSPEQQSQIIKLVDLSLDKLNEYKPLNNFDMVVSVESTAPLNELLIKRVGPRLKPDVMVVSDLFVKNTIDSIKLDDEMLNQEKSEKTKQQVQQLYNNILKSKKSFFIKDLRASFRRYFMNFLKFKDGHQKEVFDHILGKNVLLMDDSVGEVSTFKDMIRLITEYKPKECVCYAFLKDY